MHYTVSEEEKLFVKKKIDVEWDFLIYFKFSLVCHFLFISKQWQNSETEPPPPFFLLSPNLDFFFLIFKNKTEEKQWLHNAACLVINRSFIIKLLH